MPSIPFTLRQLEYFDAIASEGSLAAAALRCHVSASALALAVDELEQHLSLQLFVRRKGKGVTLTAAGSRLLSHAKLVLSGAESLAADASRSSSGVSGRFAVGCFSTLTPFYLPGIMEIFQRRHPEIELELAEASALELTEMMLQGRLDAALLYTADVSAQLTFDPVQEYRPYIMVAKDHRLAGRDRIRLGELAAEPMILLDVHPSRSNTEQLFSEIDLRPRIGHVTANFELVRCLVARGLGYGVLYQRPAAAITYDGNALAVLEIGDKVPQTFVGLARPAGAPRSARYAALYDYLVSDASTPERRAHRGSADFAF